MSAAWKSRGLVVVLVRTPVGYLLKLTALILIFFIEEQTAEAMPVFFLIGNIVHTGADNIFIGLPVSGAVSAWTEKETVSVVCCLQSFFYMMKELRILVDTPALFIRNPENKPVNIFQ